MKQSLIIVISMLFLGANAQDSTKMREDALNVFIDCSNAFCDEDYIRQNLSWVNYVRDRKAAQLHLLISSQSTAGNGDEFLLDFIGLKEFEGLEFQLTYSTNSTQTRDEIRAEVVEVIKMGFMPFVAKTNLVNGFEIRYEFEEELKDEKVEDKWKSWVVDISTNGWFNGQESRQSLDLFSNFSVKKITDKWKYVFGFFNSFNENKFKFEDEVIVSTRKSNSFDGKVIRSLGPKFSYGAFADVSSSTFRNIDLSAALYTGFEYNFFPYSESSRHMLRVNYGVGAKQNDYTETTIFDKDEELLFQQRLSLRFKLIQEWGNVGTSIHASSYLHDFDLNNVSINSNVRVRIVKGLSVNLRGGFSFIHDQVTLPKGEATLEETLLQQRQISTQFSYHGSVGLSYTFGSIYNNIVNPRFGFD